MKQDVITRDVAKAADYIAAAWKQGIVAILGTGQRLIEIRELFKSEPGKWSRLIGANEWKGQGLLPFTLQHAYRLIAIANDGRLLTHELILPSDSYTLYQLTRLPVSLFEEKMADGTIRPEMQRADVQLLLNRISRAKQFEKLKTPALPDDPVPVLYADPPWEFRVWREIERLWGRAGTLSNHAACRHLRAADWQSMRHKRRHSVPMDDRADSARGLRRAGRVGF